MASFLTSQALDLQPLSSTFTLDRLQRKSLRVGLTVQGILTPGTQLTELNHAGHPGGQDTLKSSKIIDSMKMYPSKSQTFRMGDQVGCNRKQANCASVPANTLWRLDLTTFQATLQVLPTAPAKFEEHEGTLRGWAGGGTDAATRVRTRGSCDNTPS